jgi:hypothetical protein
MGEFDPQARAGPQQPRIDERRAVVDVDGLGNPARGQRGTQRGGQADSVLGEPEPIPDQRAGMIINEGEQIGLPAADVGSVQGVAGPEVIRALCFEPAEHRRHSAGRAAQTEAGEVPLQGPLVRGPAQLSAQDPADPGRGPIRVLPPQPHRQLHDLGWGPRAGLPRVGDQRVEPTGPPIPYPPVHRLPRHPDPPPERIGVLRRGDRPHQPAPLLGRMHLIRGLPDQLIPKQSDRPGAFGPRFLLVFSAHALNLPCSIHNGHGQDWTA